MQPENKCEYRQKIVSLGGGTGHYTLLRGLVQLNEPKQISAIVGTWDSGGSSGNLRVSEGILPPGDYMQCLLALMESQSQLEAAIRILRDRTDGHPLVNLLAAKSEKVHHGVKGGIQGLRELFRISGQVIPVTLYDVDLGGETKKGTCFNREHLIDKIKEDPNFREKDELYRVYLEPAAKANPDATLAIQNADKIIIPPGSPYTSSIPHLLVKGIPKSIKESPAKLVLVLNLMTTAGEDHHLNLASDWLKVFQYYLGDNEYIAKIGQSRITHLIANENHIDKDILDFYQKKGQDQIKLDAEICQRCAPGIKIVTKPLDLYDKYNNLLRHDPVELAKTILNLA